MSSLKEKSTINLEEIIIATCKLPYCKIDRDAFLSKQLKGKVSTSRLEAALKNGTVNADIPIQTLRKLADGAIKFERNKAAAISTVAGIPGGLTMIGTIPVDMAQFYAHIFRITQKLAYIYGYLEIDLDDATESILMIFLGVMFGVGAATAALAKLAAANAAKIGTRIASKPLSKYAIYNIAKKVLAWIGVKVTKNGVGKVVTKAVPVIGGIVSGGLTIATFTPMANKLNNELLKFATMSPESLSKADAAADIVLADFDI
ncbi:MAG: EcsC family protein [Oscillospiraceae bacterium]|nr:EcsC family protein [Oscillospiraceae bacterium]